MLNSYHQLAAEREAQGIPALPLNAEQTKAVTELLENSPKEDGPELIHLLRDRVPPGVDEAAYIKKRGLVQ